jgi:hypothetical protein
MMLTNAIARTPKNGLLLASSQQLRSLVAVFSSGAGVANGRRAKLHVVASHMTYVT